MQISTRIALNCSIVAVGQALTMYNFNGNPREAWVAVVFPIILGIVSYLEGQIARKNTAPISIGLVCSSLSYVATCAALSIHPILGYPLFQVPAIITAILTVRSVR